MPTGVTDLRIHSCRPTRGLMEFDEIFRYVPTQPTAQAAGYGLQSPPLRARTDDTGLRLRVVLQISVLDNRNLAAGMGQIAAQRRSFATVLLRVFVYRGIIGVITV